VEALPQACFALGEMEYIALCFPCHVASRLVQTSFCLRESNRLFARGKAILLVNRSRKPYPLIDETVTLWRFLHAFLEILHSTEAVKSNQQAKN
jgi:hypothetical protein